MVSNIVRAVLSHPKVDSKVKLAFSSCWALLALKVDGTETAYMKTPKGLAILKSHFKESASPWTDGTADFLTDKLFSLLIRHDVVDICIGVIAWNVAESRWQVEGRRRICVRRVSSRSRHDGTSKARE